MGPATQTIDIFDKGNGIYELVDRAETTPLYHVFFNPYDAPHMTVRRVSSLSHIIGTATLMFVRNYVFSSCQLSVNINDRALLVKKIRTGLFANSKRAFESASLREEIYWKSRSTSFGFLELVDGDERQLARFKNSLRRKSLGSFEIVAEVEQEGRDEIVVSGLAILQEEMSSMGAVAIGLAANVDSGYVEM
ncbi:hypothetical protein MMC13_006873 [Lambiella insularis]|nr:hypothetical protein [Lambiella insularis]